VGWDLIRIGATIQVDLVVEVPLRVRLLCHLALIAHGLARLLTLMAGWRLSFGTFGVAVWMCSQQLRKVMRC
jgi:hypothetical protein